MDIGEIVTSSFYYAKEGLIGHWRRWFILIIGTVIFPILYGYTVRVMQGNGTAPEVEGYLSLFFDGLKLVLIQIIYAVPAIILTIATVASALSFDGPVFSSSVAFTPGLATAGLLLALIIYLIAYTLILPMALVSFARSGRIGEAFQFNKILAIIRSIGWIEYILALIILFVIMAGISVAIQILSFIGIVIPFFYIFTMILSFAISPAVSIFHARYIRGIYLHGNPDQKTF